MSNFNYIPYTGSHSVSEIDTTIELASNIPQMQQDIEDLQNTGVEEIVTYSGVPPLVFESNGEVASAYSIEADMIYTGEPSKTTPNYPHEFGDLVQSGAHSGQYAINIVLGETTKTIYLNEPLRKFDTYVDTILSTGVTTRKIAKLTFNGSEPWGYTAGMLKLPFDNQVFDKYLRELELIGVCSHYEVRTNQASASLQNGELTFLVSSSGTNNMYIRDTDFSDADSFKTYLSQQYSAGTPVCVWYIMATEKSEIVSGLPTLVPIKGSNTLIFDTDTQPTNCSITCTVNKGGGGASSANKISYNKTDSGLSATNVQDAIDEIVSMENNKNKCLFGTGYGRTSGDLSNGEALTLNGTNCKKNNMFSFVSKVSTFNSVIIGQGYNTYSGAWIEINNTKLIVHNYTNSDSTVEYEHDLTIQDYLFVKIFVDIAKATVVIYSNGKSFKQSDVAWNSCNGDYFAQSVNSTLTDCVFTWASPDFRKSVWVFGDSYVGLNNPARWAAQLRNNGFAENVLINGYAGESSPSAVTALTNSLNHYGQPEKLIWCLGMNDGADSNNTPSTNYSNGITQVKSLCDNYDIELILATIPTVPSQNNEAKNNFVRTSGNRFIDFAKSVGATSTGEWFSGMLSSDNIHPTESGAIALYNRALADCPELIYTNP